MKNKNTYRFLRSFLLVAGVLIAPALWAQGGATIKMPIKFKVDESTEVLGQIEVRISAGDAKVVQKVSNQFNIHFDFSTQKSSAPRIDFMLKKISGDVVNSKVKMTIAHAWSKPFKHGELVVSDNCYSAKRGRFLYLTGLKNGTGILSIPFAIDSEVQKCGAGKPSSEITIKYKISGIEPQTTAPEKPIAEVAVQPTETPETPTPEYSIENPAPETPTEETAPIAEEQSNPEQDAWTIAHAAGTVSAYEKFIKQFPNSTYLKSAERQISRLSEMILSYDTLSKNEYRFTLQNVISPRIDSIVPADGVRISSGISGNRKSFDIQLLDSRKHTLYISDASKPMAVRFLESPLSNLLIASMEESPKGMLDFIFKGGIPPYTVYFKQGKRYVHISPPIFKDRWSLEKAFFNAKDIAGASTEPVYAEVWDSLKVTYFDIKTPFLVERKKLPWAYIGGALALLALLFLGYQANQNAKRKKMQDLVEKRKKELNMGQSPPRKAMPQKESSPPGKKETVSLAAEPALDAEENEIIDLAQEEAPATTEEIQEDLMPNEEKKQGFVIKKIRKAHKEGGDEKANFASGKTDEEDYYLAALNRHWTDTKIENIGLHKKAILGLNKFLHTQNVSVMDESEGAIPEIGGFLMGSFFFDEERGVYQVSIEEFVPVSPSFNNVYSLEFSTNSIVQELGDAQDHFPDLSLIGWFHTHPGHGLFLSKPDLTIHEGFFREPYQFAMEIDSMTEDLDCAFFSRKSDGKMNNKDSRIPGSIWFPWVEIEKITRRKS